MVRDHKLPLVAMMSPKELRSDTVMTAPSINDLIKPQVLAEPHTLLHDLRRQDAVQWCDALGGWVVLGHVQVVQAFRDHRLSNRRVEPLIRQQLGSRDPALAADFARVVGGMMLMQDGDDHHRLRILGNHGFTPSMLNRSDGIIQEAVDELLDRAEARPGMDLVVDLAQPLPARIIGALFDIPEEDRELFQQASDAMARFFGGTLGDVEADARAANAAALTMERYFLALRQQRQRQPGDDLMSLFIQGEAAGRLTPEEVCSQCVLLLVGGHVTTIYQIANAVHALLQHADQWRLLQSRPELLESAVEELLRFEGALSFVYRIATEDLKLAEKHIRRGQFVYLCLAAANRDPSVFPDPDKLDLTRRGPPHLAFGLGPHICIGAGLARRELRVALTTLLRRCGALRLDERSPPVRECTSLVFRGFRSLPVLF
jgi:cytochrome P450